MNTKFDPIRYSLTDAYSSTEILVRLRRTSVKSPARDFSYVPESFAGLFGEVPKLKGLKSICPVFLDAVGLLPIDNNPCPAPPVNFIEWLREGMREYLPDLTLFYWNGGEISPNCPSVCISEAKVLILLSHYRLCFHSAAEATAALAALDAVESVAVVERAPNRYIMAEDPVGTEDKARKARLASAAVAPLRQAFADDDDSSPSARERRLLEAVESLAATVKRLADAAESRECCKQPVKVPDPGYQNWAHTALECTPDPARGVGVRVAMFDLGVQRDHPDLDGRVEFGLSNKRYVQGLGVVGLDAVTQNQYAEALNPHAVRGHHGTAVAGVMVGKETGLLPQGTVISYQVSAGKLFEHTNAEGKTVKYYPVDSVLYGSALFSLAAHDFTVDVVNISLGGSAPLCAFEITGYAELVADNIQAIAGSGNHFRLGDDPSVLYPARHESVMSIGAVGIEMSTQYYKLADFSNHDPDDFLVNLVAPGVGIYTCMPTARNFEKDRGWCRGTSFAAPWVSALYALAALKKKKFELPKVGEKLKYQKAADPFDTEHGFGLAKFSRIFEDATSASATFAKGANR